ncbi:hypothetical protein N7478_010550 [Penicillium angulare]|uniref:uncharacterized protein n=1 Tax=Penicillium angulare TaxID=116970 RepID=UPI002540680A|nr:uncharacterized protein N7478_010550 [Penicillium angulare]KAJ5267742.1 hypothetical protein N7478_010550 [Penicillium angulare]
MPAHSSQLLQPLDVGCFAVLKRAYGRLVEIRMRRGFNHVDKLDFLDSYPDARFQEFKPEIIKSSFTAAGLVPLDPDRVISKLNIQLRTPTLATSRGSESSRNFTPKTPRTLKQLHRQASSIKKLLNQLSKSPQSPSNRALNQLIKGCEITMQNAKILAQENHDLRAANEKQKQKRTRSRQHEGLYIAELEQLTQIAPKPDSQLQNIESTSQSQAQESRPRAPPTLQTIIRALVPAHNIRMVFRTAQLAYMRSSLTHYVNVDTVIH